MNLCRIYHPLTKQLLVTIPYFYQSSSGNLFSLSPNKCNRLFATKSAPRGITHYNANQKILLVGEGDFSFSHCLARAFKDASNLIATSKDSYEEFESKYHYAVGNIIGLRNRGAVVHYNVDVTRMTRFIDLLHKSFDCIVFNMPHAGFHGEEDDLSMIDKHSSLVQKFLEQSSHMLNSEGQVHVTHKTGKPYDDWDLVGSATKANLRLLETMDFKWEDYPGYYPKRGDYPYPDNNFDFEGSKTFKFVRA